jgi:hypothetical protein
MSIEEILEKLIGPVTPVGESNTDEIRLQNIAVLGGSNRISCR